jgi:nucleotide-binding universal stress UspA family protein
MLQTVSAALPPGQRRQVELVVRHGSLEQGITDVAGLAGPSLTVLSERVRSSAGSALGGTTPERLARRLSLPVLVLRTRPASAYVRPLAALRLDGTAEAALSTLLDVVPPPRPAIALLHVYPGFPRGMIFPSFSAPEARTLGAQTRQSVVAALDAALIRARCGLNRVPWRARLVTGDPSSVIRETATELRSDLLVLGARASALALRVLRGSVLRSVLKDARCDVLIVPTR